MASVARCRFVERTVLATAAVTALFALTARAHEHTLADYEASLVPKVGRPGPAFQLAAAPGPEKNARTCQLVLRLIDAGTKEAFSGLVCVTRADGSVVPLSNLFNRGAKLRPGHPGAQWHALIEDAAVAVPQEALTLEAFSGLDTELFKKALDLSGRDRVELTLQLKHFYRAGAKGWHGGNTHLHLSGLTREQADEYLRTIPRADGLDLVFVSYLRRVNAERDYISNTYTPADLERLSGHGVRFGNGEEHRHNFGPGGEGYGHVMFLNIRQLIQPVSIGPGLMGEGQDFPPLRHGIEEARRGHATVVWCHNTFGLEDVPDWLAGLLHAHNIFDGGSQGSYADTFYRFLNIGLRVPFSTGTDWFIYDFSRVYARLDKPATVRHWLDALQAGRTFISNGPLLELRAGQHDIGDTVRLERRGRLKIVGRAVGRHDFKKIELVHNGQAVQSRSSRPVAGHFEAELTYQLEITEPGWIALRVASGSLDTGDALVVPPVTPIRSSTGARNEMGEALFAHTSPIYIELAGRSIFREEAARALIADMQKATQAIQDKARFADEPQQQEIMDLYHRGIETLQRRLTPKRALSSSS